MYLYFSFLNFNLYLYFEKKIIFYFIIFLLYRNLSKDCNFIQLATD
jgi:hypothetical protein